MVLFAFYAPQDLPKVAQFEQALHACVSAASLLPAEKEDASTRREGEPGPAPAERESRPTSPEPAWGDSPDEAGAGVSEGVHKPRAKKKSHSRARAGTFATDSEYESRALPPSMTFRIARAALLTQPLLVEYLEGAFELRF